jgi:MFS family permease
VLQRRLAAYSTLPRNARLYVTAEALSACATGAFGTAYNLYVVALGFDTAFLGTLLVAALAGAGTSVVPAGALVDRVGPRAMLLGGSLLVAGGVLAQLLLPVTAVLLAGNVLAGAGAAAFYVAAAPFLALAAPPERRNEVFSLDTAAALGGAAAGSVLAGQVAATLGAAPGGGPAALQAYRLALWLGSAVGALSFPVLLLTREESPRGLPTAPAPDEASGRGARAAGGLARSWRATLRDRVAVRLTLAAGLAGLGAGLVLPFLNVYFVTALGASPAVYGWVNGAATLTGLLATLVGPPVAARVGNVAAVAGAQLASAPLFLLMGWAPYLPAAALAVLLRGALVNLAAPLQSSFTMGALRPALRGAGNAQIILAANVCRAAAILAGGALIARTGYRWPFLLTAALYALAGALFWWWFGGQKEP